MADLRFEAVVDRVAPDRPEMSGRGLKANVTIGLAGLATISHYTVSDHVPASAYTPASKRRPRHLPLRPSQR
jgi:hypothetical protein